jgi:hypothetical protein
MQDNEAIRQFERRDRSSSRKGKTGRPGGVSCGKACQLDVTVNRVLAGINVDAFMVVIYSGFAGVRQTEDSLALRAARNPSAPNESLKVQNEVGLEVRYFAAPADKFYDSPRASKPTSGKWDYSFEVGIALKERRPFGVSNPEEIGVAKKSSSGNEPPEGCEQYHQASLA